MDNSEVRLAAQKELKRREWASLRGKATRAFLYIHPEMVSSFETHGTIVDPEKAYPKGVTHASLILALNQRAKRKEASRAARLWAKENPEAAAAIAKEVRDGK